MFVCPRTIEFPVRSNMKYTLSLMLSVLFCCCSGQDIIDSKELVKQIVTHKFKIQIESIDLLQNLNYENGVIGTANIEFKDIEAYGLMLQEKTVVIKRFLKLTRWNEKVVKSSPIQGHYNDGWYLPANLDSSIVYRVFRVFSINNKRAVVQIPDNVSYQFVMDILLFSEKTIDLSQVYEFKFYTQTNAVIIRTLETYVGNLNASGSTYKVEVQNMIPTGITYVGRWIS